MKKILVLLCVCTLLLLPACSSDKPAGYVKLDPASPVTVEVWHYYNGAQKAAFDGLVSQFNETVGKEQGIVVEAYSQGGVNDTIQAVKDARDHVVGASDLPNIFATYADDAFVLDQDGLLADLDPYFTEEELKQYIASYLQEGRFDREGNLKIFPVAKSTEVLLLNETDWHTFVDATGADLSQLSTLEGLTEVSKRYFEWSGGKAFFGRDSMANYLIAGSMQLGQPILQVKDGALSINLEEKTMRALWDNYYVPYINGWFAAYGNFRSDDAKTGGILCYVGSTSSSTYFPNEVTDSGDQVHDISCLVLEAPRFEGGASYAVQQGAGMAVCAADPKEEYASVVFLKWFTETEQNVSFSAESGYLPVKAEANDNAKIDQALETVKNAEILRPTLEKAIETVKSCTMYTAPVAGGSAAARVVLDHSLSDRASADLQAINSLVQGGMSRNEAVSKYDTDENFRSWLGELESQLEEAVSGK